MGPFAKYWGPGRRAPGLMYNQPPYVATEHRHVRQDSLFSATVQCYYVRCLRDSLSLTDSGSHSGTPFETPFVDFFA